MREAVLTTSDWVGLVLAGGTAVLAGALVFRVDSMARATYLLALSFVAVAGVLLVLDLPYLAALTVLMMVIEMAVMGVFMIMYMMNPGGLMPMSMFHNTRGAAVLSGGTFVVLAAGALLVDWPTAEPAVLPADSTYQLGDGIMGSKMLVMMTVSPVLFVTIVGAVAVATARGRYGAVEPADAPEPTGTAPSGNRRTAG